MDKRDELTKELFNAKVSFSQTNPSVIYTINGIDVDGTVAARLTGAPDGADITLDVMPDGDATLTVEHKFFSSSAQWTVQQYDDGGSSSLKYTISMKPEYQNKGYGLRMFAHEAYTARELGISSIVLWAAGSKEDKEFNGYYSWPRYGFDAALTAAEIAALPQDLRPASTVQHLMQSVSGRNWWKENGTQRIMTFHLQEELQFGQLAAYLAEKKVQL